MSEFTDVEEYRDPATMLKGVLEGVRLGEYGDIRTVAIAIRTAQNDIEVFGGGMLSEPDDTLEALQKAAEKLEDFIKYA